MLPSHSSKKFQSIHPRQTNIKDDQVDAVVFQQLDPSVFPFVLFSLQLSVNLPPVFAKHRQLVLVGRDAILDPQDSGLGFLQFVDLASGCSDPIGPGQGIEHHVLVALGVEGVGFRRSEGL